jgi:hypothetical protein
MKHIQIKSSPYEIGVDVVSCVCTDIPLDGIVSSYCPYKYVLFYVIDVEEINNVEFFKVRSIGKYLMSDGFYMYDSDGLTLDRWIESRYLLHI